MYIKNMCYLLKYIFYWKNFVLYVLSFKRLLIRKKFVLNFVIFIYLKYKWLVRILVKVFICIYFC